MRDSILRVIDDLETRIEKTERLTGKDPYKDGINRGKCIAYSYAIENLKLVLDESPNTKG